MEEGDYSFRKLNVLLGLLDSDIRQGSLSNIAKQSGYNPSDGIFYSLKEWLCVEGILVEDGDTKTRCGFGEKNVKNYKVKQDIIISILCDEWKTKAMYKAFRSGKIPLFFLHRRHP